MPGYVSGVRVDVDDPSSRDVAEGQPEGAAKVLRQIQERRETRAALQAVLEMLVPGSALAEVGPRAGSVHGFCSSAEM